MQMAAMRPQELLLLTGDNYYGEYPLAFAACFGHEVIYDYLIDHGADPNLHDSFGNTVLHMLVINNQIVSDNILSSTYICYTVDSHVKPVTVAANYLLYHPGENCCHVFML